MGIDQSRSDDAAVQPDEMGLRSDQRLEIRIAAASQDSSAGDRNRIAVRMAKNPALVKHQIGFCATHLPIMPGADTARQSFKRDSARSFHPGAAPGHGSRARADTAIKEAGAAGVDPAFSRRKEAVWLL